MDLILDLRILSSALKHGTTEAQIEDAVWNTELPPLVVASEDDPPTLVLLCVTPDGLHLEIAMAPEGDGRYRVFHAMPMRERDKRWFRRQKRRGR